MKKSLYFLFFVFLAVSNITSGQYTATTISSQPVLKGVKRIVIDNAGNTIITGEFSTTITLGNTILSNGNAGPGIFGAFGNGVFISKIDPGGSYTWSKQIGINSIPVKNGCSQEYSAALINAVAVDGAGNIYLTGCFKGSVSFDGITIVSKQMKLGGSCSSYSLDIFTAKMSPAGVFIWAKTEGTDAPLSEMGNGVTTDNSGNAYTTGIYFQKSYTSTQCNANGPYGAALQTYIYVVKYNSAGTKVWEKKYAGNSYDCSKFLDGRGIVSDGASMYVLGHFFGSVNFGAGYTLSSAGTTLNTVLLKIDGSGNTLWAKSASGTDNSAGNLLLDNNNADIYITSSCSAGTISCGNNQSVTTAASSNFIAKYGTGLGNCLWVSDAGVIYTYTGGHRLFKHPGGNIGTPSRDAANNFTINEFSTTNGMLLNSTVSNNTSVGLGSAFTDIVATPNGFLYSQNLTGSYDIGGTSISSTQPVTGSSYKDIFLVQYTQQSFRKLPLEPTSPTVSRLKAYPNPTKDVLYLNSANENIGLVYIYDLTGKKVYEQYVFGSTGKITTSPLPSGIYFIKVRGHENIIKLIKN